MLALTIAAKTQAPKSACATTNRPATRRPPASMLRHRVRIYHPHDL